jgi:hypothetical protein
MPQLKFMSYLFELVLKGGREIMKLFKGGVMCKICRNIWTNLIGYAVHTQFKDSPCRE